MELKISRDSQISNWSFANDGGAQGVYGTGLFIDEFSYLDIFWFDQKVALASAGLATISIGFRDATGAVSPAAIMPACPFNGPYVRFLTTNPSGLINTLALEIVFAIGVADLTDGELLFIASYFNKDL